MFIFIYLFMCACVYIDTYTSIYGFCIRLCIYVAYTGTFAFNIQTSISPL